LLALSNETLAEMGILAPSLQVIEREREREREIAREEDKYSQFHCQILLMDVVTDLKTNGPGFLNFPLYSTILKFSFPFFHLKISLISLPSHSLILPFKGTPPVVEEETPKKAPLPESDV